MKKSVFIPLTVLTIVITSVIGWEMRAYSETESPYDNACRAQGGESVDQCCVVYNSAIENLKTAWSENLESLKDQEIPASEMVSEGFENFRTYRCWLEYTCRAVEFSGYNTPKSLDPKETGSLQLTSRQLGRVPGCQKVENLELSTSWTNFAQFMKENWDFIKETAVGSDDAKLNINMDLPENLFVENGIGFMPQCMTDITNNNLHPSFTRSENNYKECMEVVESVFGCSDGDENCESPEVGFVQLESALQEAHSNQQASALENKLSDIINKMLVMENHVEYVKTKLQSIDARYACFPSKCD